MGLFQREMTDCGRIFRNFSCSSSSLFSDLILLPLEALLSKLTVHYTTEGRLIAFMQIVQNITDKPASPNSACWASAVRELADESHSAWQGIRAHPVEGTPAVLEIQVVRCRRYLQCRHKYIATYTNNHHIVKSI